MNKKEHVYRSAESVVELWPVATELASLFFSWEEKKVKQISVSILSI